MPAFGGRRQDCYRPSYTMPHQDPDHQPETKGEGDPDDLTLGGYLTLHSRPPAFKGSDGNPYTVSIEVEHTGNLRSPHSGYLVFPRWAETGVGIVGHVETPTLVAVRTAPWATQALESFTLYEVKDQLEQAIIRQCELRTEEGS